MTHELRPQQLTLVALLAVVAVGACSSDNTSHADGFLASDQLDGSTAGGGATTAEGGAAASGGQLGRDGSAGTGGVASTDGSAGSGGTRASGGMSSDAATTGGRGGGRDAAGGATGTGAAGGATGTSDARGPVDGAPTDAPRPSDGTASDARTLDGTASVEAGEVGSGTYTLPADRATAWRPGVTYGGSGIPKDRPTCASVNAADYTGKDSSAAIQAALDACPVGQAVALSAGTFTVNNLLLISKGITLRGAGAGVTLLQKTNGAFLGGDNWPDAQPIVIIGPSRWTGPDDATSQLLSADAAKGTSSVTIANAAGFAAGQFVLLDETTNGSWQTDPLGRGKIWASPDFSIVWQLHDPIVQYVDDFDSTKAAGISPTAQNHWATLGNGQDAASWFGRQDRPHAEIKEVAAVSGNVVSFTTPLHTNFRAKPYYAELTRFTGTSVHVKDAGVESLGVKGGSDGSIRFESAAYCWARNIENSVWSGEAFAVDHSFRVEIRDSYVHEAAVVSPGGGAYALSLAEGSAELLYENNINVLTNKVMVARMSGAGSVIAYNYMDDGYIFYSEDWIEIGLNGSHMVGPHHMLFEGNYSFNFDSDDTHGNSTYHTVFRNWLRGTRHPFVNPTTGNTVDDRNPSGGPKRCGGAMAFSYSMSFVGNVLGAPGEMSGWIYDAPGPEPWIYDAIWMLGWEGNTPTPYDPQVAATALRDGNWDWVQGKQSWHNSSAAVLPDSLYLPGKPPFFGSNPFPWVEPSTGTVYTLPAKARYDLGTPNSVQ